MVGHVNRAPHNFGDAVSSIPDEIAATDPTTSVEPVAPVLTDSTAPQQQVAAPLGEVHGVAEIRDANGNLKGTFTFGGPTGMTREQLEQELGISIPLVTGGEKQNGGDPDHDGT